MVGLPFKADILIGLISIKTHKIPNNTFQQIQKIKGYYQ